MQQQEKAGATLFVGLPPCPQSTMPTMAMRVFATATALTAVTQQRANAIHKHRCMMLHPRRLPSPTPQCPFLRVTVVAGKTHPVAPSASSKPSASFLFRAAARGCTARCARPNTPIAASPCCQELQRAQRTSAESARMVRTFQQWLARVRGVCFTFVRQPAA